LGWELDGEARTIALPSGNYVDYIDYTETMLIKCIAPPECIQEGNIKAMTAYICHSRSDGGVQVRQRGDGKGDPKFVGIGKASAAREAFIYFIVLVKQVAHRPMHVRELCSTIIDDGGYCDVCGTGVCGMLFPLESPVDYIIFCMQLSTDIQKRFYAGGVVMGDLELSAELPTHDNDA
jgi:hypothetical protein